MSFQPDEHLGKRKNYNLGSSLRKRASGSVLPIVVIGLVMMIAFVAFVFDVTRVFLAGQQLEFAAQAAALHVYSYAINPDGSYRAMEAQENMLNALEAPGGSQPWNTAPSGPPYIHGPWQSGVHFGRNDVVFTKNPLDNTENFLQVTASRSGDEALNFFVLPAIFAINKATGGGVPSTAKTASLARAIEVIGQPASRIGPGPPKTLQQGSKAQDFQGFATFPLALSYSQFQQVALPSETRSSYTIVITSTANQGDRLRPDQVRGYFVNVLNTGDTITYYGPGQGDKAIGQLIASIKYFSSTIDSSASPPAAVERGSRLACFDAGDPVFTQRRPEIVRALKLLRPPGKYFILPILANPVVGQRAAVVGFARMQLIAIDDTSQQNLSFTVQITESVPVRNATVANGLASIPSPGSKLMPAPPLGGPFDNRVYLPRQNAISRRPRSVVLAPSLSPRRLLLPRPLGERSSDV